jgi:hypothetical protein
MRRSQSHLARQLLDAAQALKQLLPTTTANGVRANSRVAHVPVEFLEQCAVFFDETPAIAKRLGVTSDQIRTIIARTAALGPVVAEIRPMAKQLRDVLNADRALIGSACLKAYDYARSNARSLADADLASQAERMSAALFARAQRGGRKKQPRPLSTTSMTTTTTTESSQSKEPIE